MELMMGIRARSKLPGNRQLLYLERMGYGI